MGKAICTVHRKGTQILTRDQPGRKQMYGKCTTSYMKEAKSLCPNIYTMAIPAKEMRQAKNKSNNEI